MDLYSILGVPASASADEIERAYRRLARRYHPGLNPGDRQAEERYRQVDQAYQVLADAERRREYDQGATGQPSEEGTVTVAFAGFDFSSTAEGSSAGTFSELFADVFQQAAERATSSNRGLEIHASLRLSFEDAIRGGAFPLSIVRQEFCPPCGGQGWAPVPPTRCPDCEGQGTQRWARGHMVFTKHCERCEGRGFLNRGRCRACGGVGVQTRGEVASVQVPPGVESGARLVVPGRGHAVRGAAPGDLFVDIDVAEHRVFQRCGRDLRLIVPLAVHEAALGARVEVPTLDGRVKLRVPPGASSGQQLRVRGRGVPAPSGDADQAGDLLVELQIVLPAVLDERSRTLLREFAQLNDVDVRKQLFDGEKARS